jgi:hypothetical protein
LPVFAKLRKHYQELKIPETTVMYSGVKQNMSPFWSDTMDI